MLTKRDLVRSGAVAAIAVAATKPGQVLAQSLTGAPASRNLKYSTPMTAGGLLPRQGRDAVRNAQLLRRLPGQSLGREAFDNLDFQRAVQAYLFAIPAVSQAANRNAIRTLGPSNTVVPIFEQLVDSRSVFLTANDNTVYSWTWVDLSNGPVVVEVPPKVLGADQRHVVSLGRRCRHHRTGQGRGRQVPVSAAGLQGRRCRTAITSCNRPRSTSGSRGAASWWTATRSRASISSRSSRRSIR